MLIFDLIIKLMDSSIAVQEFTL